VANIYRALNIVRFKFPKLSVDDFWKKYCSQWFYCKRIQFIKILSNFTCSLCKTKIKNCASRSEFINLLKN